MGSTIRSRSFFSLPEEIFFFSLTIILYNNFFKKLKSKVSNFSAFYGRKGSRSKRSRSKRSRSHQILASTIRSRSQQFKVIEIDRNRSRSGKDRRSAIHWLYVIARIYTTNIFPHPMLLFKIVLSKHRVL